IHNLISLCDMYIVLKVMRQSPSHLLAVEMKMIFLTTIATALLFAPNVGIASAQQLTSIPVVIQNGTFQNTEDGFRVQVPDGWVVQDVDNFHLPNFRAANEAGFLILAIICPQQEALQGIGGLYNCEQSESSVEILHDRLGHRPEFEVIEDPNTTIRTVPAKFVEMTYQPGLGLAYMRSYSILATIPENPRPGLRQVVSGDYVTYGGPAATTSSSIPPTPVQQIFQSFEFIRKIE